MKVLLELKILASAPKSSNLFLGDAFQLDPFLHFFVLVLSRTYTNGSNHSVFPLHLPMLLYVVAGTPVPRQVVGHLKERQNLEQKNIVLALL